MKKIVSLVVLIILSFILSIFINEFKGSYNQDYIVRSVILENEVADQVILDQYTNKNFEVDGLVGMFSGYQTFNLGLIDNVNYTLEDQQEFYFEYQYSAETYVITLTLMTNNKVVVDSLEGAVFLSGDQIDAHFFIEHEIILLSELLSESMLDNVLFSSIAQLELIIKLFYCIAIQEVCQCIL